MDTQRWIAAVALLLTMWAGGSWAWPPDTTEEEMALLPPYCSHTADGASDTPGYLRWREIYGDSFHNFHHYCYGVIYLMRADRHSTPEQARRHALSQAFREIQYVVRTMPRTHVLLPELLTRQGMILRRLKKPREGARLLEDATELNPKYWRAYSELAQCYLALDDKKKAREALEEGLANVPDSKVLNAMLRDLGGANRAR